MDKSQEITCINFYIVYNVIVDEVIVMKCCKYCVYKIRIKKFFRYRLSKEEMEVYMEWYHYGGNKNWSVHE